MRTNPSASTSPDQPRTEEFRSSPAADGPPNNRKSNAAKANDSLDKIPLAGPERRAFERGVLDRPELKGQLHLAAMVLLDHFHRGKADSYAGNRPISGRGHVSERTVRRWIGSLAIAGIIAVFHDMSTKSRRRIVFIDHPHAPEILLELRSNRHIKEVLYEARNSRCKGDTPVGARGTKVVHAGGTKVVPLHLRTSEAESIAGEVIMVQPEPAPLLLNVLSLELLKAQPKESSSSSAPCGAEDARESEPEKLKSDDDDSSLRSQGRAKAPQRQSSSAGPIPIEIVQKIQGMLGDHAAGELERQPTQFLDACKGDLEVLVAGARCTQAQPPGKVDNAVAYLLKMSRDFAASAIPEKWRQDGVIAIDPSQAPGLQKKARAWIRDNIADCQKRGFDQVRARCHVSIWIGDLAQKDMDDTIGKGESEALIKIMRSQWLAEEMETFDYRVFHKHLEPGWESTVREKMRAELQEAAGKGIDHWDVWRSMFQRVKNCEHSYSDETVRAMDSWLRDTFEGAGFGRYPSPPPPKRGHARSSGVVRQTSPAPDVNHIHNPADMAPPAPSEPPADPHSISIQAMPAGLALAEAG